MYNPLKWDGMAHLPSTSAVSSVSSDVFRFPGGKATPIDSNFCLNKDPPFLDFAL